jgi:outer membrane protein assembly factor BamB
MFRPSRRFVLTLVVLGLTAPLCFADANDPPPTYYNAATGTGATLKSQLNTIIKTGYTALSYDSARSNLQITDADPNNPGHMLSVYDRTSINVAAINPGGSIPGWDGGVTWNREHTWPQSRGIVNTSSPDGSDLFELRPASSSQNGSRGNNNYGGAFGARTSTGGLFGNLTDNGHTVWYPGDADAGMIAREEFYLAVRYDGTETNTLDLELANGAPAATTTPPQLGDLSRMIEWNYAAPPDDFERRRNQIIYSNYQHSRDPFTDHPEWVWSIFVNQTNDSQIAISGAPVGADGSSTKNVDLGRVFVGASVPGGQSVTLNKGGLNGTYYQMTTAGEATSTLSDHFNAFRSSQTDSTSFNVGLNTNTATAGLRSGSVTVDNLDITTGGGAGHGANDANDTVNVSLTVLDHATPSFDGASAVGSLTCDFGSVSQGSADPTFNFSLFNYGTNPTFTADLDFDAVTPAGDSSVLTTDLAGSAGSLTLAGGLSHVFTAMLDTAAAGMFSATYTLMLSDENIAGALNKSLTLTLMANVTASAGLVGDYNGNGIVDAADYTVWQDTLGQTVTPHSGADGDGDGVITEQDYQTWASNFGNHSPGAGAGAARAATSTVPEPCGLFLISLGAALMLISRRGRDVDDSPSRRVALTRPSNGVQSIARIAQQLIFSIVGGRDVAKTASRIAMFCGTIWLAAVVARADDAADQRLQSWHQWRGPDANGSAPAGDPPTKWDEQTHIKWKVPLPGAGDATPIIWGDKIFILTAIKTDRETEPPKSDAAEATPANHAPVRLVAFADGPVDPATAPADSKTSDKPAAAPDAAPTSPQPSGPGGPGGRGNRGGRMGMGGPPPTNIYQFVVMCLDRKTGKPLWQQTACEKLPHEAHHETSSYASASPITDGKHVFCSFGSRGIYCYDMDGNLQWKADLGKMKIKMSFGEGASPALYGDSLIVNWDHEAGSFITALDTQTGHEKWKTPRDETTTWNTPLVVEYQGKPQIVVNGTKRSRGYDLETGNELWECGGQMANPIPSSVSVGDMAYCLTGFRGYALFAIPLGSTGDITGTDKIAWHLDKGTPYVSSPLVMGDRLYYTKDRSGIMSCVDAKTGDIIIDQKRLPESLKDIYASPVGAAGRVYVLARSGDAAVIDAAANDIQVLAENHLDDTFNASPAIVGKELYLRGEKSLYCVAE